MIAVIKALSTARAALPSMAFASCPSVAASISTEVFWQLMSIDPQPRIIPGAEPADFVATFGTLTPDGGAAFEFGELSPSG